MTSEYANAPPHEAQPDGAPERLTPFPCCCRWVRCLHLLILPDTADSGHRQALKQDFGSGHGKGKALCMETYKNFFHSYRMPHEHMDRLLPQSRRSNHIVVASCDQFYILRLGQDPLDNPYRKDASSQLNESSIFEQLLRIYRVSREHARRQLDAAGGNQRQRIQRVGLFTTESRERWARLHKRLCHCNPAAPMSSKLGRSDRPPAIGSGASSPNTNTESLRQIEDCLFVMCLDSLVGRPAAGQTPADSDQVHAANVILTGAGTGLFTANRWFDKFLQIIVGRDGICGINIEHSASEGITVLRFLEEFLEFVRSNPISQPAPGPTSAPARTGPSAGARFHYSHQAATSPADPAASSITSPNYIEPSSPSALLEESDNITPLKWHLNHELETAIDEAERRINALIENFSLVIIKFDHFGRAFIKSQNLSPDAFVQLALQYTFYKLHGQLVSTYESASLRQFRLGRVDNIRANTCEAFQWIQSMLACLEANKSAPAPTERSFRNAEGAFIKAITKQVEILRYTIIGSGPDNHMLALRELAKIRYGPDELPGLFQDNSYKEYLNFRLSTSQLPNESGIYVGYGAVVQNGYGCSYNPCEDKIVFCVSSFADCPQTSSSRFAQTLQDSLLEMKQLCLGQQAAGGVGN